MARQYLNLAQIYGAVDNARANEAAMENNRLQNERYQRQISLEDRELARQEGIRNAYRGAIEVDESGSRKLNRKKAIDELYGIDALEAAKAEEGFAKSDAEAAKVKREGAKAELENRTGTIKYLKDKLSTVRDDAGYQAFKQEAQELGAMDLVKTAPPQFNPEWQRSQMVNADKFLEQNTPKYERVDLGGKIQIVDVNPVTNPKYAQTQLDKTLTPGDVQSGNLQRYSISRTDARAAEANELKAEENAIKRGEKIPENSTGIRKEFEQLPEVKNYKQALPAYKGVEDAVKRNTTASDINIVYGIAKLYDPTSVVREGEYATVANSPNIPERVKGYAQYLANGGKLTPEVKKQILTEAKSRMGAFENEYKSARDNYSDIAKRSNADPTLIFPSEYKSAITPEAKPPAKTKPPIPIKSDNDYKKLPKGTVYLAPDGTKRTKQ